MARRRYAKHSVDLIPIGARCYDLHCRCGWHGFSYQSYDGAAHLADLHIIDAKVSDSKGIPSLEPMLIRARHGWGKDTRGIVRTAMQQTAIEEGRV